MSNLSDTISETFSSFSQGDNMKTVVSVLSTVLALFLILYASLAAPKLPKSVSNVFDNVWFKLLFMFLIAYMATKDLPVAIISSIALLVTLQTLSAQRTTDVVVKEVKSNVENFREYFANGSTVAMPEMDQIQTNQVPTMSSSQVLPTSCTMAVPEMMVTSIMGHSNDDEMYASVNSTMETAPISSSCVSDALSTPEMVSAPEQCGGAEQLGGFDASDNLASI